MTEKPLKKYLGGATPEAWYKPEQLREIFPQRHLMPSNDVLRRSADRDEITTRRNPNGEREYLFSSVVAFLEKRSRRLSGVPRSQWSADLEPPLTRNEKAAAARKSARGGK